MGQTGCQGPTRTGLTDSFVATGSVGAIGSKGQTGGCKLPDGPQVLTGPMGSIGAIGSKGQPVGSGPDWS